MSSMKPILITVLFVAFASITKAQQADTISKNQVFTAVEQEPIPPGGMQSFFQYLQANVHYPDSAAKHRIEGKVFVSFVVETDGALTNVKASRSVSPDLDSEAIRVVSNAPKWKPGIQNGRAVRVQYSVTINFKLPAIYTTPDSLKVFTAVEQEPTPQGGIQGFYEYLARSIQYPEDAKRKNIQGKVFLTFVIEKDGSLTDIKILRGVSPDIDAEAIRVLRNAPKWNPGMQGGRPVRVQYQVPLSFALKTENY